MRQLWRYEVMISAALAVIENEQQRNELSALYEKNKDRFLNIVLDLLHNKEEAEDAVQETFLRIADKPDNFFSIEENLWYHNQRKPVSDTSSLVF